MFTKKLLSIVALLFIGNQVVKGLVIPDCTSESKSSCTGTTTEITYLCKDGLTVYGYASSSSTGTCLGELTLADETVHVIGVKDVLATSSEIKEQTGTFDSTAAKLAILDCASGTCTQKYGYAFDGTSNYKIKSSDDSELIEFASTTTCSTSNIGEIFKKEGTELRKRASDTIELCLEDGVSVEVKSANAGDYLMVGTVLGSGSSLPAGTLTSTSGEGNAVVKVGTNYIILNESYTTDEAIYCANENNKLEGRFENYCSSTECDYYTCATGRCTESAENTCPTEENNDCNPVTNKNKCANDGYYIVNESNALITKDNSAEAQSVILYHCTGTGEVTCVSTGFTIPTGYIPNADNVTASGKKYNYIKCAGAAGSCVGYETVSQSCANDSAGELVLDSGTTLTLCLRGTNADGEDDIVSVALSSDNAGSYFVDIKALNIFGDRSSDANGYTFVIVDVTATTVKLHGKGDTDKRYKYTDTKLKIYPRDTSQADKNAKVCGGINVINEFELNQCTDYESADNYYYKLGDTKDWSS